MKISFKEIATIVVSALIVGVISKSMNWSNLFAEKLSYQEYRVRISDHLVDPKSADFRKEFLSQQGYYCGEMNSKNRMGGYIGFSRFFTEISGGAIYIEGEEPIGASTAERADFIIKKMRVEEKLKSSGIPTLELKDVALRGAFEDVWQANCNPNKQ